MPVPFIPRPLKFLKISYIYRLQSLYETSHGALK